MHRVDLWINIEACQFSKSFEFLYICDCSRVLQYVNQVYKSPGDVAPDQSEMSSSSANNETNSSPMVDAERMVKTRSCRRTFTIMAVLMLSILAAHLFNKNPVALKFFES